MNLSYYGYMVITHGQRREYITDKKLIQKRGFQGEKGIKRNAYVK